MSLCREFFGYVSPDKQKQLAAKALVAYVYKMLSTGNADLYGLKDLISQAEQKGISSDELTNLKTGIDRVINAVNEFNTLQYVVNTFLEYISSGEYDKVNLNALKYQVSRTRTAMEAAKSFLGSESFKYFNYLSDLVDDITAFMLVLAKVKSSIDEAGKAVDEMGKVVSGAGANAKAQSEACGKAANIAYQTSSKLKATLDELGKLSLKTDVLKPAVNSLKTNLQNYIKFLDEVKNFYIDAGTVFAQLDLMNSEIGKLGQGDNYLFNTKYRNSLVNVIAGLLIYVRDLNRKYSESPFVGKAATEFYSSIINYMNSLKQSLVQEDFRWVDVFKEAQQASLVNLWSPPSYDEAVRESLKNAIKYARETNPALAPVLEALANSPITKIAEGIASLGWQIDTLLTPFVKNVFEANLMNFQKENLAWKVFGFVGMVGGATLDALTALVRPSEVKKIVEGLVVSIQNTIKAVQEEGMNGLGKSVRALIDAMFGSPERIAMTLGNFLAAVAIATAVEKIPLPTRARAYLTNILQVDPIGLSIVMLSDPKIVSAFSGVIRRLASSGKLAATVGEKGVKIVVDVVDSWVGKAKSVFLKSALPLLKKVLAEIILGGEEVKNAVEKLTKAVSEIGIAKAREIAAKFESTVVNLFNNFGGEALYRVLRQYAKDVSVADVPQVVKTEVKISKAETLYKAVDEIGRKLKVLTDEAGNLENVVKSLKSLMGKSADELLQKLNDAKTLIQKLDVDTSTKALSGVADVIDDMKSKFTEAFDVVGRNVLSLEDVLPKDVFESLRNSVNSIKKAIESLNPTEISSSTKSILNSLTLVEKELSSKIASLTDAIKKFGAVVGDDKVEAFLKDLSKGNELIEELKKVGAVEGISLVEELQKLSKELGYVKATIISVKTFIEATSELVDSLKTKIAKVFDTSGFKDLSSKVLSATPENLVSSIDEAVKSIITKLDVGGVTALGKLTEVVGAILQDPNVSPVLKSNLNKLVEFVKVSVTKAGLTDLTDVAKDVVEIGKKYASKLPPYVVGALQKLEKKVAEKAVSLADIEDMTNVLAKVSPEVASAVEISAISELLSKLSKIVDAVEEARLADVTSVRNGLKQVQALLGKVTGGGEVGVVRGLKLDVIPAITRNTLDKVMEMVSNNFPDLLKKYKPHVDTFLSKLESGIIDDEFVKASEKVFEMVRELEGLSKPKGVRAAIKSFVDNVKDAFEKLMPEDKAKLAPLKRLADVLEEDLNKSGELLDGWGYVYTDVSRIKYTPLAAPLELIPKIKELLSTGEKYFDAVINDIRVKVLRKVNVLPDGTFDVQYVLEFPEGRKMYYRHVVRSVKEGVADVSNNIAYDPPIADAVADYMSKNTKSPLYRIGEVIYEGLANGKLIEMVDPDFNLLKQIAVVKVGGLEGLGRMASAAMKAVLVGLLATSFSLGKLKLDKLKLEVPEDVMWYTSLSQNKLDALEKLKNISVDVDEAVKKALADRGFDAVAKVPGKVDIIIATPTTEKPKLSEKDWVLVQFKDQPLVLPKITIPEIGKDVIVVPTINVSPEEPSVTPIVKPKPIEEEKLKPEFEPTQGVELTYKQLQEVTVQVGEKEVAVTLPTYRLEDLVLQTEVEPLKVPQLAVGVPAGAPAPKSIPFYTVSKTDRGRQLEVLVI